MGYDVHLRIIIQNLIESNMIRSGGDFHLDELDEESLIKDLEFNFKLTSKVDGDNNYELIKNIIKSSNRKIVGMFKSKEFRQTKFLQEMFDKFEIEKYDDKR